jgi:hypothetical protein
VKHVLGDHGCLLPFNLIREIQVEKEQEQHHPEGGNSKEMSAFWYMGHS